LTQFNDDFFFVENFSNHLIGIKKSRNTWLGQNERFELSDSECRVTLPGSQSC